MRAGAAIKGSSAMKLRELGEIGAPVLLFGGPCSNLQATRALLARARAARIGPDRMICTGDIVAYCAQPAETIAEIRAAGCAVVAGNCEKQLAAHRMDCGCGFAAGSTCDRLSAGWYAHADAHVGAGDRTWMAGLPDMVTFRQGGRRFAVIHGGATDVSRFLWPVSPEAEFAEEVEFVQSVAGGVEGIVAGHCGLAFRRRVAGVDWINAGVIGLPANDGRSQTRFAILKDGRAEFHALSYDHAAARAAMAAAGLTQGYDTALESGYWPSEDVLPPGLRRRAARASG